MDDAESTTGQDRTLENSREENYLAESPSPADELEEQKRAYTELNDRFLRLAADFENFKKRSARDREVFASSAYERFALDILEVLDNFDRALNLTMPICVKEFTIFTSFLTPDYCAMVLLL